MKKFEIGKVYSCRSVCDYDCVWQFEIIKRTEKTVTLANIGVFQYEKYVTKKVVDFDGVECVFPRGKYSMAPILKAA